MDEIVAAAAGFLIAVLWFDLMFDVQAWRHRREPALPEAVLDSTARYYRRVTTDASPMGRLVAVVMVILLVTLVAQLVTGRAPVWVSVVSLAGTAIGVGLAGTRALPYAQRLGRREDAPDVQSALARSILRDHLICLGAMSTVLASQLVFA